MSSGAEPMASARRERLACRLVSTGNWVPLHALEDQDRAPAALALELHHQRGDLVGRVHLPGDDDQVVGLAALDLIEISGKALRHVAPLWL